MSSIDEPDKLSPIGDELRVKKRKTRKDKPTTSQKKEKRRIANKKWADKNRDIISANQSLYYAKNKEICKQRMRAYHYKTYKPKKAKPISGI